jgi:hypothetical protein
MEDALRDIAREAPWGAEMNTTRLTIGAIVLSILVVERTFAQGLETADVLAPAHGPVLEAPAGLAAVPDSLGTDQPSIGESRPFASSPIAGAKSICAREARRVK